MRLGKINTTVFVTQNDRRFEGTNYANERFTLMITNEPIKKIIKSQLAKEIAQKEWDDMQGTGEIPQILLSKWIFLTFIDDWQGFEDEAGATLEATLENKSRFYDFDSTFFNLASLAYMDNATPNWDKKEKEEITDEQVIEEAFDTGLDISAGNIQQAEDELVARYVNPAV